MTVVGSKAAHAFASPWNNRAIVCCLVPAVGPRSPAMSTNELNSSGCITVRSTAQVPPIDHPTMPQLALAGLAPNCEIIKGTTSLVRWSAALPRLPLTHSVSLLNEPPESTNTNSGALPPCALWKSSIVLAALPVRSQSAGVLNSPAIIITTGNFGGGLLLNHAGGRYTNSVRCLNPEASLGIVTGTRAPWVGTVWFCCIVVTVAVSVSSGSGPAVSWFHAVCTVGKYPTH